MEKLIIIGSDYFQQKHVDEYIEKHSEDIYESYFGDSIDKPALFDFLNSSNLFGMDQFVVIREADKILKDKKIMENLGKSTVTSVLLLSDTAPKKPTKSKTSTAVNYTELGFKLIEEKATDEKAQNSEVIDLFNSINIPLSKDDAQIILERCFFNLSVIKNEVTKISTYNDNTPTPITNKNVLEFIQGNKEEKHYMLTSAFGNKNLNEVFRVFKTLPHNDDSLFGIFYSVTRYINSLYEMKLDPSILENMKGGSAFYKKKEVSKWTLKELTKAIDTAAELDIQIKTGIKTINNAIIDLFMIASN